MKKSIIILIIAILLLALGYIFLNKDVNNRITISTSNGFISVIDPFDSPVQVNPQNTVLVGRTEYYDIVYFDKDEAFLITLSKKPLAVARDAAEKAFLKKLDISKDQACELDVSLKTIGSVDLNLAGEDYGLSFCPNGIPFPRL